MTNSAVPHSNDSKPAVPLPRWMVVGFFGIGAAGLVAFLVFSILSILNLHDASVGDKVAQYHLARTAALQECAQSGSGASSECVAYRRLLSTPEPRELAEYEKKHHIG